MKYKSKTFLITLAGITVICLGIVVWLNKTNQKSMNYTEKISIGKQSLLVEIVNNSSGHAKGLSRRESLPQDAGMLFDFRPNGSVSPFWMLEMRFGIDIIWIKDGTVIGITKNIPKPENKNDEQKLYHPPGPVDMVVEVNAGWTDAHGISLGEKVSY